MTGWSIEPEGVQSVLKKVKHSAEELGTAMGGIGGAQESLNAGTGITAYTERTACVNDGGMSAILAPVASALGDLLQSEEPRLKGIASRIQACALGAADATTAYIKGNEEMAATTQANAVSAASSGDLSFFTGGGR
jgi:hypothetical protein